MDMPDAAPSASKRRFALLLALGAVLAGPAATAAASGQALLIDACRDEKVDGTYSQKDYVSALASIPTDGDEYLNCREVIRRAQLAAAARAGRKDDGTGGGSGAAGAGGPGGSGSSAAPARSSPGEVLDSASPAERAKLAAAGRSSAPVQIGGRSVSPTATGLSPSGAANVLPTPLLVALILLGAGLLAAAAHATRSRVLARRFAGS